MKQIPSIVFNAVKDEKLFDLVKIETEKNKKKTFYEDRPFKEGDKVLFQKDKGSWRENKTYIILFLNEKAKGTKYEKY